jgi:ABC-type glutathione transport system ATPase component
MRFEIRRLHDQYRYTTVYVTHDQAEAMTTADLIAVMNKGRVEQLGPPEEIYTRPRSEFVARFIGGSNVLAATALDEVRVSVAGAAHHGWIAVSRAAGRRLGPPARDRHCPRTTIFGGGESPARDRDTPGVPGVDAGLHGHARRRNGTARHRAAGAQHRARSIGLAASAGGTMPGIGGGVIHDE